MRLIDADALKSAIDSYFLYADESLKNNGDEKLNRLCTAIIDDVRGTIDMSKTIDARPVRYGRWQIAFEGDSVYSCSECHVGMTMSPQSNLYCHHCGAKMTGSDDSCHANRAKPIQLGELKTASLPLDCFIEESFSARSDTRVQACTVTTVGPGGFMAMQTPWHHSGYNRQIYGHRLWTARPSDKDKNEWRWDEGFGGDEEVTAR